MKDKDIAAMRKMVEYAIEIQSYVNNMDYAQFLNDRKTVNACAFLIGQIGELVSTISAETQVECKDIPWRNIKGMRNKIIHDYEKVDYAVL